jgi:hypothetical protein
MTTKRSLRAGLLLVGATTVVLALLTPAAATIIDEGDQNAPAELERIPAVESVPSEVGALLGLATTVPPTTVPPTTVPATTVPATTVPPTTAPVTTVPPPTVPPAVAPVAPQRLFDTREGASSTVRIALPKMPLTPDRPVRLRLAGVGDIPASGAVAVSLNLTVVDAQSDGFLTVYPCGTRPLASNVNYSAGQTVANAVLAALSDAGELCLYSSGTIDLVGDLGAWLPAGSGVTPVIPRRLFDTRPDEPQGAVTVDKQMLSPGGELAVSFLGAGPLPTSGVRAVSLNVTVVDAVRPGFLAVYPCGTRTATSNVNFVAGRAVANTVVVGVPADGRVCFSSNVGTHVLADVNAWYDSTARLTMMSPPQRLYDSRPTERPGAIDLPAQPLERNTQRSMVLTGVAGVPSTGVAALVLNVTAVNPEGAGFLTVYPCGGERPEVSNLNFVPGSITANAVLVAPGAGGRVCFFANTTTDVVVDVGGWFSI